MHPLWACLGLCFWLLDLGAGIAGIVLGAVVDEECNVPIPDFLISMGCLWLGIMIGKLIFICVLVAASRTDSIGLGGIVLGGVCYGITVLALASIGIASAVMLEDSDCKEVAPEAYKTLNVYNTVLLIFFLTDAGLNSYVVRRQAESKS